MSVDTDYAHTRYAEQRRLTKAKLLARWCYERGIGTAIAAEPADVLRQLARRAGVPAPHIVDGSSPTWAIVTALLDKRAAWDQAHGVRPPPAAACIRCTVTGDRCGRCESAPSSVCISCGTRLDPFLISEGVTAHPGCPMPATPRADAVVAQPRMF